jgi:hypothetical protein
MSREPLRFKQSDVTKAVRAVVAAGIGVREVVVDANGAIRIIVGEPANTSSVVDNQDDLDRELAEFERAHR